jgi:hypothetical protein
MEAADKSVSIDLLIRSLIVSGASGTKIGEAFAPVGRKRPARKSARRVLLLRILHQSARAQLAPSKRGRQQQASLCGYVGVDICRPRH